MSSSPPTIFWTAAVAMGVLGQSPLTEIPWLLNS